MGLPPTSPRFWGGRLQTRRYAKAAHTGEHAYSFMRLGCMPSESVSFISNCIGFMFSLRLCFFPLLFFPFYSSPSLLLLPSFSFPPSPSALFPSRYSRVEPFTALNVDIRNQQHLFESLDAFVKGDLLEGANAYHCEKCDKKVCYVFLRCYHHEVVGP